MWVRGRKSVRVFPRGRTPTTPYRRLSVDHNPRRGRITRPGSTGETVGPRGRYDRVRRVSTLYLRRSTSYGSRAFVIPPTMSFLDVFLFFGVPIEKGTSRFPRPRVFLFGPCLGLWFTFRRVSPRLWGPGPVSGRLPGSKNSSPSTIPGPERRGRTEKFYVLWVFRFLGLCTRNRLGKGRVYGR